MGTPTIGERVVTCLESIATALVMLCTRSRWATVREAERYAHVAHGVVREAVKNGELPAYRRSPKTIVLINLDDIDVWIRTRWLIKVSGVPGREGE